MTIEETKDEFKKQLRLRGYSFNTIEVYGSCAALFMAKFITHKPSKSEIEDWLLSFSSEVYRKHLLCSVKAFNKYLNKNIDCDSMPYPRPESKLPEILSPHEVQLIFNACNNSKHKCIMALLYSAGLRISEVINLKLKDIDRHRGVINIRQSKGKKDRQVPLADNMLQLFEKYYREFKPVKNVFNGQSGSLEYSAKSVQEFLKKYANIAGIKKRVHPHQFRHSMLTELFNNGTDSALIQQIAGHSKLSTTMRYVHLSNVNIKNINSPLSQIRL